MSISAVQASPLSTRAASPSEGVEESVVSRKVVFLGATSGIGRGLARAMAARGDALYLLGREQAQLERSAADLEAQHSRAASVRFGHCDLLDPERFEAALAEAEEALGGVDTVVVTAGMFATQQQLEADPELARRLLTVNFAHTVLFCEAARKCLIAGGGGQLVVFSSVAGERGRKPVVLYGASKAGLSAYLEGLDHRFHDQGLRVLCVKPGFVKTEMTAGLSPPPFAGEVQGVAADVLRAMERSAPVVYSPAPWAAVMQVIRLLPRFVMRRVGF